MCEWTRAYETCLPALVARAFCEKPEHLASGTAILGYTLRWHMGNIVWLRQVLLPHRQNPLFHTHSFQQRVGELFKITGTEHHARLIQLQAWFTEKLSGVHSPLA